MRVIVITVHNSDLVQITNVTSKGGLAQTQIITQCDQEGVVALLDTFEDGHLVIEGAALDVDEKGRPFINWAQNLAKQQRTVSGTAMLEEILTAIESEIHETIEEHHIQNIATYLYQVCNAIEDTAVANADIKPYRAAAAYFQQAAAALAPADYHIMPRLYSGTDA
jgi:hypothetical protein